ncbi:lipopolysaccharide biosynthesis protein [Gordonia sp. SCSIO 19800]|uniref:lipopolysaccharide biosynthesis protein n=1 Tax=Gordonia sp. SCSIO 19800 TaxID=2826926 RepID=UPI001B828906|nr:hypothetical protein [Gordonia sp. SCSIO 19800]MBR7191551.1 hypothetical protein [Gordonia sp. SCSIO 19800]
MGLAAAVYTVVALFQKSMALLLLPFVTHVMPPDVYGLVSLVTVVGTVIGILLCSPVENAVFRWAARETAESEGILSVCALYGLVGVPLLGVASSAVLWSLDGKILGVDVSSWSLVVLAASLMAAGVYFGIPLLRARDQLARFVLCSASSIIVNFSLKIWLVFIAKMGLEGWILSELASSATLYLFVLAVARPRIAGITGAVFGTLARYALPLLPHRLAFWGLTSLSRPIMAMTASLHQLGLFSLAANCMAVSALLAGEINRAVLVEYGRENVTAPTPVTRGVARVQLLVALVVPASLGFGVALFGPLIFAPEYEGAYPAMAVLLVAQCAYALYLVPMNYLCQTLGDTRFSWLSSCAGAATVLGILLALGDGTTAIAAAAVTALGYMVMAVVAFQTCARCGMRVAWRRLTPRVWVCTVLVVSFSFSVIALASANRDVSIGVAVTGLALLAGMIGYSYRAPARLFSDSYADEQEATAGWTR